MPNWCHNSIDVTKGDAKEVFDSIRSADSLMDFNKLISMPEDAERAEWLIENWGADRNAIDARYSPDHPNVLFFDTAWAPPAPVFEAVAQKFPKHEFLIYSDEYDTHQHYIFTAKDGQLAWEENPCQCVRSEVSIPKQAELLGANGENMNKPDLTLRQALGMAEHAVVARINLCWPPEFGIFIIGKSDRTLTFGGFSSRAAAWDAIEAVSSFKRPTPKPDQDVIDNQRFPGDDDCGAENGTRSPS